MRIGKSEHSLFLKHLYSYISSHMAVKRLPDSIPPEMLSKDLPKLQAARVYAEPVYTEVEEYMEHMGRQIGKENRIPANLVLCSRKEELEKYFSSGKMPRYDELRARDGISALIFVDGKYELVTGKGAEKVEASLHGKTEIGELRGVSAYPGKAIGKARIIVDPKKGKDFRKGEILITGMTRPEYIHLIKLAGAVVTDAGGMLSHAAITARELHIPTIVGPENATKVFREGEMLEVDATRGIVRKKS